MRKKQWQHPLKGQKFLLNSKIYEVVGLWFRNSETLVGIEIKNELGQITEVTPEQYRKWEGKITYTTDPETIENKNKAI